MFAVSVSAQTTVTEFEYFIDQGAEFGEAISVDVADNATQNQSFNIPFTNLSPGIHTVFMRCKNNLGLWSHTVSRVFLVQENQPASAVTVIEYSIDQMPYFGEANTIVLTEPSSDVNFAIEISPSELENLSEGPHVVYVRVKDNNDEWSHTNSIVFIKVDPLNAPIVGAEFFIGEDPGVGMAEAQGDYMAFAQPAMQGVFPLTIPPNLLINGFNLVGIRTKNSNGEWSHTRFFEVIVQIEEFVTGTIQSSSETICYNTIPNAISVTAAAEAINGGISYQWYSRSGIHTASGALSLWNILDGENMPHPSLNKHTININVNTGEEVILNDILKPHQVSILPNKVITKLKKTINYRNEFPFCFEMPTNFFITNDGIGFLFNPYKVAPFSSGYVAAFLNNEEL